MPDNKNKKRFSDYGFSSSYLPSGKLNSITDVAGVTVGHVTKIEGTDVRTGVTVIDPGIKNLFRNKLPCAIHVGNGYGKMTGTTQVDELGTLETPIALTNTLAVGSVMRGLIDLVINQTPDLRPTESINAIVGEVNDGLLNNIRLNSVSPSDVTVAYETKSKTFALGNVGAGTGTRCFSWKGGIGTASREIIINSKKFTVGVLTQTNFGGSLNILGIPFGKILGKTDFIIEKELPDGSCINVIATDAPLSARQLKRLAKRSPLGLARTGSIMATGSGDYAIAFSTNQTGSEISDNNLNNFFLAVVEIVEESIYDALFAANKMIGRDGNILEQLPLKQVVETLSKNYAPS
jgi:D-aminopeptidase